MDTSVLSVDQDLHCKCITCGIVKMENRFLETKAYAMIFVFSVRSITQKDGIQRQLFKGIELRINGLGG
jgi:hypothetical protein